jgi:RimJ/RimL family protein N-acetyltransferase
MPVCPTLTDGVVLLTAHTPADAEAHLAQEDEEQARRFGWYPARSTMEHVLAAFARWQEAWNMGGATRALAMREVAGGALAGGCEIRLKDEGIAHLSYYTFPDFRRRGLAARAVRLACAYAFTELGVERAELYIEPDNAASRGVARRAGFTEEGLLRGQALFGTERRDMVLYARLATD